jgi:hypothetical protein
MYVNGNKPPVAFAGVLFTVANRMSKHWTKQAQLEGLTYGSKFNEAWL